MEFKVGQFAGPLDLLLNLIQEKQLNISDVSISLVTEQFLDYLETIEEAEPEELADFLVIATRLLFLKSRTLLPQLTPDEDDGVSLEEQLRLYQKFVKSAEQVNILWNNNRIAYQHLEPPKKVENPIPPDNLILDNLHLSMLKLVNRLKPPRPLPETKIDRAVSLKEKIVQIRDLLKKQGKFIFSNLLNDSSNRTEIIVNFLAILELVRQRTVFLEQDDSFGEIIIKKV